MLAKIRKIFSVALFLLAFGAIWPAAFELAPLDPVYCFFYAVALFFVFAAAYYVPQKALYILAFILPFSAAPSRLLNIGAHQPIIFFALIFSIGFWANRLVTGKNSSLDKSFKLPLRYETDGALPRDSFSEGDMVDFDAFTAALSVKPRISRDTVAADVETAVSLLLFTGESSDIVASCTVMKDRPREKAHGVMKLYYPEKDETLWDIAKACGTTERALRDANGITGKEIPIPIVTGM